MAKSYELQIAAHPNIYDGSERELTLWFSEPDNGVNADTGILLLSHGFGQEPGSDSSKQARERLADEFNFVTVQCAYFGSRFMGAELNPKFVFNTDALRKVFTPEEWALIDGGDHVNMDALLDIGRKYPMHLEGTQQMDESLREFNDMGIMQALDNVAAVLTVAAILDDNGLPYDLSRIMAYGHGHGAYLHHLCNAIAPQLFAAQIDYGSWLYPDYLLGPRVLYLQNGKLQQSIIFPYFALQQPKDIEFMRLNSLYKRFQNQCQLICLEDLGGNSDKQAAKKAFCNAVPYAMYIEAGGIREASKRIDTDYYGLFDYVMNNLTLGSEDRQKLTLPNTQIHTSAYRYDVLYNQGLPQLVRTSKAK